MDPHSNPEPGTGHGAQPVYAPPAAASVPQAPPQGALPVGGAQAQTAALTPPEAADTDVIEPEWVAKAKEVVAKTRTDPAKLVRAMNLLKADYMKKRYDKELKLPDA